MVVSYTCTLPSLSMLRNYDEISIQCVPRTLVNGYIVAFHTENDTYV